METETEPINYNKQYYEKNKARILKSISEKVLCECGKLQSKGHLSRHLKTKTHHNKLSKLNILQ